jgi:hypothetical protein
MRSKALVCGRSGAALGVEKKMQALILRKRDLGLPDQLAGVTGLPPAAVSFSRRAELAMNA